MVLTQSPGVDDSKQALTLEIPLPLDCVWKTQGYLHIYMTPSWTASQGHAHHGPPRPLGC